MAIEQTQACQRDLPHCGGRNAQSLSRSLRTDCTDSGLFAPRLRAASHTLLLGVTFSILRSLFAIREGTKATASGWTSKIPALRIFVVRITLVIASVSIGQFLVAH